VAQKSSDIWVNPTGAGPRFKSKSHVALVYIFS